MTVSKVAKTIGLATLVCGPAVFLVLHHARLQSGDAGFAANPVAAADSVDDRHHADAPASAEERLRLAQEAARAREAELNATVGTLRRENEELAARLTELERRCASETDSLRQQVMGLESDATRLKKAAEATAASRAELAGERDALLSENASLRTEVAGLREDLAAADAEPGELDHRVSELADLLRQVLANTAGNATELTRTAGELDELTRTNDRLALEITRQNDEARALRAALSAAQARCAEAVGERDRLQREADRRGNPPSPSSVPAEAHELDPGAGTPPTSAVAAPIEGPVALADNAAGLVAIGVGEEHGVTTGMTFYVVRDGAAIATLEVVKLRPRLSGCRIVERAEDITTLDRATTRNPAPPR